MLDKSQDLLWRPEYRNILNFKVHEGEKKINVTVYHDDSRLCEILIEVWRYL